MRPEATGPWSNSEQVRRARFAATPTASPQGPAPITARSSINEPLSRHFDDLIAMRTHAHVLDGCVCKVLEPVQVGPGGRRYVLQLTRIDVRIQQADQRVVTLR